ncbi:hypothetical protein [Leucobacter musarum]|uniref:hypothetical protein n=1 Tax=Leucobacter musarum TaxID=1930747 RepID=UPI0006A775A5|nr:hypothetical protein [Leucobacter musarum]
MRQHQAPLTNLDHTGHAATGVGRLEFHEWTRLLWAVGACDEILAGLADGNAPSMDPDVLVQTSSGPRAPLSPTWLAADEIQRLKAKLDRFKSLDQAVNEAYGAFVAIEFGRAVSIADRRWPRQERDRPMIAMRCGGCDEMTLTYRPPRFVGDRIVVDCPKCGYTLDEDEFSVNALLIEAELSGASTVGTEETSDATA